ncbi:MAG: hypothetical protein GF381_03525 [Candidatus Pacebacteria bacterium]|nr:hypothetical protein [Candidatus Paceibacterota bacterium]
MNKLSTKLNQLNAAVLLAQSQLTNPAIEGDWGRDAQGAQSGSLFITIAVNFWRAAMTLGALYVIGSYVMAAFNWITSGDDSKGVEKARSTFINATIGLVILVSSFTLVGFVGQLLFDDQFNLLELTLPTPE